MLNNPALFKLCCEIAAKLPKNQSARSVSTTKAEDRHQQMERFMEKFESREKRQRLWSSTSADLYLPSKSSRL